MTSDEAPPAPLASGAAEEGDASPGVGLAPATPLAADPDAALRGILIKAAGAVGVGIGVIGFIVLVGGAYLWQRFSSAGLPADEAVADLSHSQLLVVGIRELAPWVGIVLVELALLYLLEQRVQGGYGLAGHLERSGTRTAKQGTPEWRGYIFRVRVGMVVLAIVVAVSWNWFLGQRSTPGSFLLAAAVAVGLGAAVLLYAGGDRDLSFTRFALAAVAATAAFALYSAASRVAEAPFVRPVALVVDGKPLGGIYVSASSGQVFVGEVCVTRPGSEDGNSGTASLIDVPRNNVSIMLIGDNGALRYTIQREASLLHSLARVTTLQSKQLSAVGPLSRFGRGCTDPAAADLLSH